jgi:hypothetical protein
MKRLLRGTVWLSLLLVLPVLLIRAQPFDARLHHVLNPAEDCTAPCFLGIRPGTTTIEEALVRLRGHAWVASASDYVPFTINPAGRAVFAVPRWEWSGAQPGWIDPQQPGELGVEGDRVRYVEFATRFQVGDVYLALGAPDFSQLQPWPTPWSPFFQYLARYDQMHLTLLARGACPLGELVRQPVSLRLHPDGPSLTRMPVTSVCTAN